MSVKEKYDSLIAEIETSIQNYEDTIQIVKNVSRSSGLTPRDADAVFGFLTNQSINAYVKCRKMMAAYHLLIGDNWVDMETAISISGMDNHSSFDKKFKSMFLMTPSEARAKKDHSLWEAPATWSKIGFDYEKAGKVEELNTEAEAELQFGIPKDQFDIALKAMDLMAIYGFDSKLGDLAFEQANELNISIEDSFSYINQLRDFLEYTDEIYVDGYVDADGTPNTEPLIRELAQNPALRFAVRECGLYVDVAYRVIERIPLPPTEIVKLDPQLLVEYANTYYMDYSNPSDVWEKFFSFKDAYEYFIEMASLECNEKDEYFTLILDGWSKEDAWDAINDNWIEDTDPRIDLAEELKSLEEDKIIDRMAKDIGFWGY